MAHPTQQKLADFLLGKLPSDSCDTVAMHLEDCGTCQETLRNLENKVAGDPLVAQLRTPAKAAPVEAECGAALAKAAAKPPAAAGSAAPSGARKAAPSAAVSKDQFLANLKASDILAADIWNSLAARSDVSAAPDGVAAARLLVETHVLTKFQAQQLLHGKTRGFRFGDYVVLDHLGAGGMGQVYKARHRRMDRVVALKVLSAAAMNNAEAVKRFQREVKAAAKLIHPNIVTAFDAGEHDGVHYLVMEFVEGRDLSAHLKSGAKIGTAKAIELLLQAARGLNYAHGHGVVHRDIKPANLLVDSHGTVKILDMGLARIDDPLGNAQDDGLTQSGQVMGTVDYMAPEQAFNTREATAAADVYSLGCTLYRLLSGRPMYEGQSVVEKILAHREKPAPALQANSGAVPPGLARLFERMVAKRAEDRPSTKEVVRALEALAASPGGEIPPTQMFSPAAMSSGPKRVDADSRLGEVVPAAAGAGPLKSESASSPTA